jgi:hypothetical protein
MAIHAVTVKPPRTSAAPEKAHVRFEVMSFGVISLKHGLCCVPRGMTKASLCELEELKTSTDGRTYTF